MKKNLGIIVDKMKTKLQKKSAKKLQNLKIKKIVENCTKK